MGQLNEKTIDFVLHSKHIERCSVKLLKGVHKNNETCYEKY